MISTLGKYFAASQASLIINIAPKAKLGAIRIPVLLALANSSSSARSASLKPVVPTTARTPADSTVRSDAITTSGRVKSTTTSGFTTISLALRSVATAI